MSLKGSICHDRQSRLDLPLLKRFIILPAGVVSKNDMGARKVESSSRVKSCWTIKSNM